MARFLAFAALAFGLSLAIGAAPGRAQSLSAEDGTAIRGVIAGQIDAFRHDDGTTAFGFAAPEIQHMYGSPELFLQAVRQAYQPVYRPRQVEFRDLKPMDGRIVQQVYVVGPDNQPKLALYFMERQADGSWRISGCVLLAFEGQSV